MDHSNVLCMTEAKHIVVHWLVRINCHRLELVSCRQLTVLQTLVQRQIRLIGWRQSRRNQPLSLGHIAARIR